MSTSSPLASDQFISLSTSSTLKRPISPVFESSASKRAASEENLLHSYSNLTTTNHQFTSSPTTRTMDLSIQESNHKPLQSTPTAITAPSAPPASSLAINGSSTSHKASQPLPSPEDQLKAYQNVSGTPMQAGQTWYLINLIWFEHWQEAFGSIDQPINLKTTQNFDPITIQTSKCPELFKRGTMKSMVQKSVLKVF
ncbi:hypothetical protein CROQUDRAFT_101580 [Cronartium quercuum f. sp. fusiforme G11]|uniref:DUSP domain-containing protein n=1 Tax=Cronartium quercuum f. sp. fusiforme G11 TaxID=708437 RepID=A0A9P6N622_9BASI|nr:hypothetical protein CROQUDRAFT_101580 [Cronartium quercuum f. sp. fusiforme G11]